MAIKSFPYTFDLLHGKGKVFVEETKLGSSFSFNLKIVGEKFNEEVIWTPSRVEIVENRVINRQTYSKLMFEALSGFWSIYND